MSKEKLTIKKTDKKIKLTIEIIISPDNINGMESLLDDLRGYAEAEITDIEIIE